MCFISLFSNCCLLLSTKWSSRTIPYLGWFKPSLNSATSHEYTDWGAYAKQISAQIHDERQKPCALYTYDRWNMHGHAFSPWVWGESKQVKHDDIWTVLTPTYSWGFSEWINRAHNERRRYMIGAEMKSIHLPYAVHDNHSTAKTKKKSDFASLETVTTSSIDFLFAAARLQEKHRAVGPISNVFRRFRASKQRESLLARLPWRRDLSMENSWPRREEKTSFSLFLQLFECPQCLNDDSSNIEHHGLLRTDIDAR